MHRDLGEVPFVGSRGFLRLLEASTVSATPTLLANGSADANRRQWVVRASRQFVDPLALDAENACDAVCVDLSETGFHGDGISWIG